MNKSYPTLISINLDNGQIIYCLFKSWKSSIKYIRNNVENRCYMLPRNYNIRKLDTFMVIPC